MPAISPLPPGERAHLLARLNGALGGILAPESFTLSQSYYIGKVRGASYQTQRVNGRCLDQIDAKLAALDELLGAVDAGGVPAFITQGLKHLADRFGVSTDDKTPNAVIDELRKFHIPAILPSGKTGISKSERLKQIRITDPVIAQLTERGLIKRHRPDGGVDIVCPFERDHTTAGGQGETTYFAPNTGGYERGHFKCLHSHCTNRGDADFLQAIGYKASVVKLASSTRSPLTHLPAVSADARIVAAVDRLARLPVLDYETVREVEAEALGMRVSALDAAVKKQRAGNEQAGELQGASVQVRDVEPWGETVDMAEVLEECTKLIRQYVPMPEIAAHTVALWIAHAHVFDVFHKTPRLNVRSPEKNCGKSTLLDVIESLSQRALLLENLSTAVFFRLIDAKAPTLLVDEIDRSLVDKEELIGALNSGHKRGATFARCEGEKNQVRTFKVFTPVVLAGIGELPGTLHDRSIVINLVRAKRGEIGKRFDSRHLETEHKLARKLARWAADHRQELESADPDMGELFNRLADNWRPLYAVADLAGGDWPKLARAAAAALSGSEPDADSIRVQLLVDINAAFEKKAAPDSDRFTTEELITELTKDTDRPWSAYGRARKPMTSRQLAGLLKPFGIVPGTIWLHTGKTAKGYLRERFEETFARFIPRSSLSDPSVRQDAILAVNLTDSVSVRNDGTLRITIPSGANTGGLPDAMTDRNPEHGSLNEYDPRGVGDRESGADEDGNDDEGD